MFYRTTLADADGVVHRITIPAPPSNQSDASAVPVTSICPVGVANRITAKYARTLIHPAFRNRTATCRRCG